jgi:hypothetical protein
MLRGSTWNPQSNAQVTRSTLTVPSSTVTLDDLRDDRIEGV